jgi:hypothetical protein
MEATSGTSRTTRGSTGTLVIHGVGDECRGKRCHPIRGRSGLHTFGGGGYVVRLSDMDGERNILGLGGQQLANIHPFRGCRMPGRFSQKRGVAWPPRALNSVTAKGMTRMSGQVLTPSEYLSNLVFPSRLRATSWDGGLESPNQPEITDQEQVMSLRCRGSARRPHPQGGRRCWGVKLTSWGP